MRSNRVVYDFWHGGCIMSCKLLIMRFGIFLLIITLTTKVAANDTLQLNYDEAVKIALKESYIIRENNMNKMATKYGYQYYKSLFKPRIDLSVNAPKWTESVNQIQQADGLPVYNSYGSIQGGTDLSFTYVLPTGGNLSLKSLLYRENIKTTLHDDKTLRRDLFYSSVSLNFNQPIFTSNTLKQNLKVAEFEYDKSKNSFTKAQMDIVYDVTYWFYRLYESLRKVEIANEKYKNSLEALKIARLKSETGRIAKGEVLSSELGVEQSLVELNKARSSSLNIEDSFKKIIGLPLDINIKIKDLLEYQEFQIDMKRAIDEALKNRNEIKNADIDIELQKIEIDKARRIREFKGNIKAYYDLTGVSSNNTTNNADLLNSSFKNFVDRPPNRGIVLELTYPIYDWGRGSSKEQKARINLIRKEMSKENLQRNTICEIREIVRVVNDSRKRLNIQKNSQKLASDNYKVMKLKFENGDISGSDLVIQQEKLSEVQLSYLESFVTYKLALNDLKRKTLWDFENNRSYVVNNEE